MLLTLILACAPATGSDAHADPVSIHGAGASRADPPREAVATLEGRSGSAITGTVTFRADPEGAPRAAGGLNAGEAVPIAVSVGIAHAGPGNHAVFLHETGDCSAPDASSAGTWFGPPRAGRSPSPGSGPATGEAGGPPPGYLGFVTVSADGRGAKDLVLTAYTLGDVPGSLVGRALVVYERAPDFTRDGDPGARQACSVIRAAPEAPATEVGRAGD